MGTRLNRENLATGHLGPAHTSEPIPAEETELKITVVHGEIPAKAPFMLALEDGTDRFEMVKVTKVAPGPVFVVERGKEGTEAVEHPTPCTFSFGITSQELADLVGALAKSK